MKAAMELALQEAQQGVRNWKERFAVAQEQVTQAVAQVEELHSTVEMLTASQKQHKSAARSLKEIVSIMEGALQRCRCEVGEAFR